MYCPIIRSLADPGANEVAITIDDGPNSCTTLALLDLLDEHKGKATFFLSGFRAIKNPELVEEIVLRGHAIYSHGWDHKRLDKLPYGELSRSMNLCELLLRKYRPTPSIYLARIPFNSGYRKFAVHRELKNWIPRCQIAHWSLQTRDHAFSDRFGNDANPIVRIRDEILRLLQIQLKPGAVILMHDLPIKDDLINDLDIQFTISTMKFLLEELTSQGFRSVVLRPKV